MQDQCGQLRYLCLSIGETNLQTVCTQIMSEQHSLSRMSKKKEAENVATARQYLAMPDKVFTTTLINS